MNFTELLISKMPSLLKKTESQKLSIRIFVVCKREMARHMIKYLKCDLMGKSEIVSERLRFSTSCYLAKYNATRFGPLVNRPDYSFLDGRSVPVGLRLKKRLQKQREYTEKIVTLSKEMDFALERYEQLKKEREENKQNIISNKLKPKGSAMLKK